MPKSRRARPQGDTRPESYVVQRGDTLFGIALDFGLDYRELAAWNSIADPSRIFAGQRLRLVAPEAREEFQARADAAVAGAGQTPMPATVPRALDGPAASSTSTPQAGAVDGVPMLGEPRAVTLPWSEKALAQLGGEGGGVAGERAPDGVPAARPEPKASAKAESRTEAKTESGGDRAAIPATGPRPATLRVDGSAAPAAPGVPSSASEPAAASASAAAEDWIWPARGALAYRFGGAGALKGLGIAGKAGSPVVAAAPGRVVYSGSGLRGYGKLVIIKHSEEYLTVYAHNQALLVKEGEQVKRGQRIAEMGDSDSERVALHFELRRFGRPVDPLSQLPGDRPPS
jgi:lipoprotein NlpD